MNLLEENLKLKLLPASHYDAIPFQELRMFCHYQARYLLPTVELIEFLKPYTNNALEIGAGCGDLGYHLGLRMTDNYCQYFPEVKEYYEALQQPIIKYGKDVELLDAALAIKHYNPDVVIGAWVTNWVDPLLPPSPGGGSVHGIKEDEILDRGITYIVIGAEEIHKHKPIMKAKHQKIDAPFVRSRRQDNKIWIWNG